MANSAVELLGLALALCGWGAVVAATALWQWQTSTYAGDNIVTAVSTYQGLWGSCVSTSTGQLQCKAYDSLLALPASTQGHAVALMLLSAILGPLALGVALPGLQCTQCGDPNKKGRMAGTGGALLGPSGLCSLVACSWYAHRSPATASMSCRSQNRWVPMGLNGSLWVSMGPNGSQWLPMGSLCVPMALIGSQRFRSRRYELGPALFVGWAGSALLLLGGSALLCSCGNRTGTGKARYPRVNNAPRKAGSGSATDYV
ncbi:claudin-7 [Coturnix japonica]|uniref:claudin-7 n=1 Tax=Coturnix japonica TaxID=93934 RepID=UPI0013A5ECEF|nr:claudin-7 [Coturnix japonica]